MKKKYATPTLIKHGNVKNLTQGTGSMGSDGQGLSDASGNPNKGPN